MNVETAARQCFARDYAEARAKFRDAAARAGAGLRAYMNPHPGPHGEALATDVAWLGPEDARRVLVTISATHGAEGFCGAGAEVDWLLNVGAGSLPGDTAALLIHAINPHGFAWLRRVTEEGVDLNRNFVDFAQPLPENPGYDVLASALVPEAIEGPAFDAAEARIKAYQEAHGEKGLQAAVSGGQYKYRQGLFYGGDAPSWSRRTTEAIVVDYRLAARALVAVVDVHTGLGPFGYGEPICDHAPGSPGLARAKAWYGPSLTEPLAGTSSSLAKDGLSDFGWQRLLGDAVTFIALEFGTCPLRDVLWALRQDHWLHRAVAPVPRSRAGHRSPAEGGTAPDAPAWDAPAARRIKETMRRTFFPDTEDWREMVLFRSRQVLRQALAGLADTHD